MEDEQTAIVSQHTGVTPPPQLAAKVTLPCIVDRGRRAHKAVEDRTEYIRGLQHSHTYRFNYVVQPALLRDPSLHPEVSPLHNGDT